MDWKDVAGTVGKLAPLVGTALGGPAGAAVGALVSAALGTANTPDAVSQALQIDPTAATKLAEIEKDRTLGIQQLAMQSEANRIAGETAAIQAVNATMQAEDKSEHWASWLWRPMIGFAVSFNVTVSSALVLAVFAGTIFGSKPAAEAIAQLPMVLGALAGINGTVLPILGIASWFRGKAQADPLNTAPVHG